MANLEASRKPSSSRSFFKRRIPMVSRGISEVESPPSPEDEEDMFQKLMGDCGRWQVLLCLAIYLVKFPIVWNVLNMVVLAPPANFTCVDNKDPCADNCSKIVFDRSIYNETIITQWRLVCGNTHKLYLTQLVTMVGVSIGSLIFGFWSDRNGRRLSLILASLSNGVIGCFLAVMPLYWEFLALRLLLHVTVGGMMVTSFVLLVELVGKRSRSTAAAFYQFSADVGIILMALLFFLLRDWRLYQLVVSIPSIFFIFYTFILSESPRWLLTVGRTEEAIKIVTKAATFNKLPTENIKREIERRYEEISSYTKTIRGNIFDLFKSTNLRNKAILMGCNWFICSLCFYGTSQYVGHLNQNLFINVTLTAMAQIPGTLFSLFLMYNFGRKNTLIVAYLVSGIPMLCIPLTEVHHWMRIFLALIAMFGIRICVPTVYVFTAELFPTIIRGVAFGSCFLFGRLGAIVAPLLSIYGVKHSVWALPIMFGTFLVLGACLCFLVPDTLHTNLPDTIEEAKGLKLLKRVRTISRLNAQARAVQPK